MTLSPPILLAAGDLVPILVFLGFVGFILVASAIANAAKQQGTPRRRPTRGLGEVFADAIRQQLEQGAARREDRSTPPPLPIESLRDAMTTRRPEAPRGTRRPAQRRNRPAPSPPRPPQAPQAAPVTPVDPVSAVAPIEPIAPMPEVGESIGPTRRKARRGATPHTLHGWLRPRTLRSQYILTEIFQKPLALRDPSDRPG